MDKERRGIRDEVREAFVLTDFALEELSSLEKLGLVSEQDSPWADEIHSCQLDLRFFRMVLLSLFTLDDICIPVNRICQAMGEIRYFISSFLESVDHISVSRLVISGNNGLEEAKLAFGNWILDLLSRIHRCKLEFEISCELLLNCSSSCTFLKGKITDFLDAILENLKALSNYKPDDEIVLFKNQIETLEKKLTVLHTLFDQTPEGWNDFKEIREFKDAACVFAHYSANLVFLYWVNGVDEQIATKLNLLLLNMLQKINPCVPVFKPLYFRFLKEMRQLDYFPSGQIIHIFLDLFLDNLVNILKDDFQILLESLMLLIAFLANPPDQYVEDKDLMVIITEMEGLLNEDLYLVLYVDDMKGEENFSKASISLSDVMKKVKLVTGKVRHVYDQIQDSFPYNFPKTNGLGFFDVLLRKLGFLKEKLKRDTDFIPFSKPLIIKIEEELRSFWPFLNNLFVQQKDHNELEDTWLKVIKLAYQTEYAINLCSVIGHPLWHNTARLMEILGEIKVVNSELKKIEVRKTHYGGVLHCTTVALSKAPEDPWASGFNEETVGLEGEVEIIVKKLINGTKSLDIVAIVGMAGLGKTTLAKKVYNNSVVKNHFHKFSFCIVSQVHNTRRILLDILNDIKGKDDKIYDMTEDGLILKLKQCLSGHKYLIIMDDLWDVDVWVKVKGSFPNKQEGSRIIFTTRIHDVALRAKEDCILHELHFLSDGESMELLQKRAFRAEGCPLGFSEVGMMIAKKCKGLPLTIVLIAGLISRTERNLSWWDEIHEAIDSYSYTQGCMDVLELSYQHLPEHLKPCFLYFGLFTEDTLIFVNKLTLLWIGEGFVLNSNTESLKNVARKYLSDLVDRSLVIANERSSYGGMKSFRIHDLVHEFCQRKAQQENFFQLVGGYEASNSSSSSVLYPYRVCIPMNKIYRNYATEILISYSPSKRKTGIGSSSILCTSTHSLLDRKLYTISHDYHYISRLKLVQVMDLEELEDIRDDSYSCLIKEITSLVHLRFIAATFPFVRQIVLPNSVSNLWNLEILILKTRMLKFPETFWNMTRLRHVSVGLCCLSYSGVKKCEEYPHMVNLESFSSPSITSKNELEEILRRSPSLLKLSFHRNNLELSQDTFDFPNLVSLSKLESLKVFNVGESCLRSFDLLLNLKKLSLSK